MSGKSGIGTFLDGILPYMIESCDYVILLGTPENTIARLKLSFCENETQNTSKIDFIPYSAKLFSLKEALFFPRQISDKINECDIFFTPYCNIPSGIKVPIFSTIHDVVFLDVPNLTGFCGKQIRKLCYKYAVLRSSAIFTVSEFSRGRILQTLHPKKPVFVVYNGIPSYLESTSNTESISRTADKTNTLLYIGNIKKHKGLSCLLDAFPEVYSKTQAKLIIVGSKSNFRTKDQSIESKLDAFPKEQVEFTGYIPDEKLKEKIQSAKVLVQPSLYEGFGIPPLQALCCKTKAVISDIPVFKEIYGKLPVTFFEVGNSQDLSAKLIQAWNDGTELKDFSNPYSYKKTAKLIMDSIKKTFCSQNC